MYLKVKCQMVFYSINFGLLLGIIVHFPIARVMRAGALRDATPCRPRKQGCDQVAGGRVFVANNTGATLEP